MELLRFFTAGNVDDGKSTLIGRLLLDSGSISTDIIETLTRQSKTAGENTTIDLALLTDGLRAEREQGITIDVAYKYFSTPNRKFIIADTPGHAQYTRNMFTGASTADLAIILIDARNGVTEQTKRHTIISSVLGIPHILVCINKMDLVAYSQERYEEIKADFEKTTKSLNLNKVSFIPASALSGENVVTASDKLSWHQGPSLLEFLETIPVEAVKMNNAARFQVQYVIRPQTTELHDYRGYAGTLWSGELAAGDEVKVLPGDFVTRITKIEHNLQEVPTAKAGQPVVLQLEDDIDISRGAWIVPLAKTPFVSNQVKATLCWMDNQAFRTGIVKLVLQQGSARIKAAIKEIDYKIDIESFDKLPSDEELRLNELASVKIRLASPLIYDGYDQNRYSGSFILINEYTNQTVAAGVLNNELVLD
ncbi:MAG: GTP-binding protein [Flavobacteriia bacterium]|nr:GTP-binding protein [Flavobacteriia bacterium]OJX36906.1 MAG: sulfate adenylyltransferase [Flavobacteriia bacterium 40-80]